MTLRAARTAARTPARRPRTRTLALGATAALAVSALAHVPAGPAAGADGEDQFARLATYPVYLNVPAGADPADETVAEISTVTADGNTMIYTDAAGQRVGFVDITDPTAPVGAGSIDVTAAGGPDDSPTSVATVGGFVLVVVDTSAGDFDDPSGRLDVVDVATRSVVRSIELGGQPDAIAVSPSLDYAAIAIENQRDEDALPDGGGGEEGDLPQAPAGFVQVIDIPNPAAPAGWTLTPVPLTAADLAGMHEPTDAEPEYVAINDDDELAVTLQENNGVVVIDLATKGVTSSWSAGTVSLTGIDDSDDGIFNATSSFTDLPREPDSIAWVGDGLVATANEGDLRGGTRGWTVFEADGGDVVWDAGTSFEYVAQAHGLFNDGRADNKGAEPEGLTFAEYVGTPYAFVGAERSNFVAVYDMSDPTDPDFTQALPTTNGPEGLLPVPSRDLLLTSSEVDESDALVRSTIGVFELGADPADAGAPAFPSIASTPADGSALPIGWTALGALSAAPGDPGHLWAASDAAVSQGRLYHVDVTGEPAIVDRAIDVVDTDGDPVGLDIEGIGARPGGGFWLGVEGTGAANRVVRLSADGVVEQTVRLPAEVTDHVRNWGIEGVAVTGSGATEKVFIAIQRPLWVDPSVGANAVVPLEGNNARIGRYDVLTGEWTWFLYPLGTTTAPGDWIGLSEITVIDDDTVAVIERDKRNGPDAALKAVYTADLPDTPVGSVTPVTKSLAYDVLPDLRATNGWTQEKLEGLTVGADHQVYAVTDNDGLDDATGETVFLRLGALTEVFADALASTTSLAVADTTPRAGQTTTATVTVAPATSAGTVTLLDGDTVIGSAAPVDGVATFPVALPVGTHPLTATWSGTDRRQGSTSAPVVVTVEKAATATSLKANKKRVEKGDTVRLTARVPGADGGTVTFLDRGKRLGSAVVKNGKAKLKATLRKPGKARLVAVYSGTATLAGSTSEVVTVEVKRPKDD